MALMAVKLSDAERKALDLFIESLLEPDTKLRSTAHEEGCFEELMTWRRMVLDYCYHIHRGFFPNKSEDGAE